MNFLVGGLYGGPYFVVGDEHLCEQVGGFGEIVMVEFCYSELEVGVVH